MSLNTMPTNYHEYEYSKFSVFKLKFMTTGRIHASRWHRPQKRAYLGWARLKRISMAIVWEMICSSVSIGQTYAIPYGRSSIQFPRGETDHTQSFREWIPRGSLSRERTGHSALCTGVASEVQPLGH